MGGFFNHYLKFYKKCYDLLERNVPKMKFQRFNCRIIVKNYKISWG